MLSAYNSAGPNLRKCTCIVRACRPCSSEEFLLSGLVGAKISYSCIFGFKSFLKLTAKVANSLLHALYYYVQENFEAQVFVGVPLVIETELIYASRAVINWYIGGELVSEDNKSYTPKSEDAGKSLSVLIVPTRPGHDGRGCEEAYRFKNLVEPLPWMPIVSPVRDGWTQKRSASERDDLRVLTYNILADLYTSRDVDQHLMYAHCDLSHLMRWRRMPMLIYEILVYNADVICLQEVDTSIYDTLLRPVLESKGYQGFYSNKASTQQEGCAMFWSTSCFEEITEFDMKTISIRDLFAEHEDHLLKGNFGSTGDNGEDAGNKQLNKWNSMDEILDLMGKHDELRRIAREKTGQILQVANLTLKNPRDDATNANAASKPKRMILANTHLFYHPMADHIRAMQAYVVCKKIDEVRRQDGSDPYPLVLCGDLNSDPLSGAVQLLFTRAVESHHETWKHLHDYRWEMGDTSWMLDHGYVGNEATADIEENPSTSRKHLKKLTKMKNLSLMTHLPSHFTLLRSCSRPRFPTSSQDVLICPSSLILLWTLLRLSIMCWLPRYPRMSGMDLGPRRRHRCPTLTRLVDMWLCRMNSCHRTMSQLCVILNGQPTRRAQKPREIDCLTNSSFIYLDRFDSDIR